jgi:uncharacterized protein with GYD domain
MPQTPAKPVAQPLSRKPRRTAAAKKRAQRITQAVAASKADLIQSGGRVYTLWLTAEGSADVAALREARGYETDREAIHAALAAAARRYRKAPGKI